MDLPRSSLLFQGPRGRSGGQDRLIQHKQRSSMGPFRSVSQYLIYTKALSSFIEVHKPLLRSTVGSEWNCVLICSSPQTGISYRLQQARLVYSWTAACTAMPSGFHLGVFPTSALLQSIPLAHTLQEAFFDPSGHGEPTSPT